jgi:hypothetical protein
MTGDRDDDPLSWGDEGDPTYVDAPDQVGVTKPSAAPRRSLAERRTQARSDRRAAAAGDTETDPNTTVDPTAAPHNTTETEHDLPPVTSSALLVTLGILGGIYLLYTVGWTVSLQRTDTIPVDALDVIMARLREYLAIAAPALWFGATLALTRKRRPIVRLLWLLLGVVLLVPLPFILGS